MSATTSTASSSNQPELSFNSPGRLAPSSVPSIIPQPSAPPKAATQAVISAREEQQVLLEAEEIASVRDMAPVEVLPEPFPAPVTRAAGTRPCLTCSKLNPAGNRFCEACGQPLQAVQAKGAPVQSAPPRAITTPSTPTAAPPTAPDYNAWLDTGPAPTTAPAAPAKAIRRPATPTSKAVAEPAAKDENFFYFYDDATAPKQNRKLLVILLVVFALGLAGIIFLMARSPAKKAPTGNVSVAISPVSANVSPGEGFDFAATVSGSGDTDVNWSVQEGSSGGRVINRGAQAQGGTVATIGVYVAPDTPGTYHLVATSKADPSKSATAEVLVNSK
jgi:hypothetical protein